MASWTYVDDGSEHARVARRVHAVAEIEDVPWLSTVVGEDRLGTGNGDVSAGEDQRRIEVALQGDVGSEALARRADRRPPVEPDHLGAGGGHRLDEVIAADAEMDAGRIRMALGQLGEHAPGVREHELLVVSGGERAGPGVEQLERLRPGRELDVDELDSHRRQGVHQGVPHAWIGVQQRLGVLVGATWAALDEVTGDGERSTGEGEHRRRVAELARHEGHRLGDVGDVVGLQRAQPLQVGAGSERFGGDGPGAGRDVDAEADGVDRNDDVGVQHGGIDAVATNRLEGDLGGQLGLLDRLEDRAVAANPPGTQAGCARPGA